MDMQLVTLDHDNQRVLTTRQLAEAYGTTTLTIRQNYTRNTGRYIEGKHFFKIEGQDLKDLKDSVTNSHSIALKGKALHLWTEAGALLHAKSLNTDKAWEVYQFLVETYFRAKQLQQQYMMPTTFADALRQLADTVEKNEVLHAQNKVMLPKAEAYDEFMSGQNNMTMDVVAKTFKMGRNKLFELLRNQKVLKSSSEEKNVPYQKYFNQGYFIVRQVPIQRTAGVQNKPQTLVSPKGLDFIRKVLKQKGMLMIQ